MAWMILGGVLIHLADGLYSRALGLALIGAIVIDVCWMIDNEISFREKGKTQ